jgi:hypothetical protein
MVSNTKTARDVSAEIAYLTRALKARNSASLETFEDLL